MSRRRARTLDVAASALVHVLPRPFARFVDQARLDAATLVDGLSGKRAAAFSTREQPLTPPVPLDAIDPLYEVLPEPLARHYATLTRDLRTVTRELRGDRLPAVVARKPVRASAPATTSTRRTLAVQSITRETDDAIVIALADLTGTPLAFVPGQFLTLHLSIDGRQVRRAYSICTAPGDARSVSIAVKKIDGGLASGHLHATLRAGHTLEVSGPSGAFVLPEARAPRHLVAFAGGSGITPVMSIVTTALAHEPGARITLVFGNRRERDVIFRERLDALERAHGERLRVVHVLEEPAARPHRLGRPDAAMVETLVRELALDARLPGEDAPLFFVCGPAPMMASVRRALTSAGVASAQIREERFLSPVDPRTRRVDASATPQPITIRRRGVERTFEQGPGETILEAATKRGVVMPSSCTLGGCGACRCRAVEGSVDVDEPSCLTDAERAEGYVLTCVGRARGPVTLEVPE